MKEQFIPHVLVTPIEILEILMEWGQGVRPHMAKIQDWANRKCRAVKSCNKRYARFGRGNREKQLHRRSPRGLKNSLIVDGDSDAHVWVRAKR